MLSKIGTNSIKRSRGFTLIELLVVLSIIALLASVILAQIQGARKKADDAKRISDLQEIRRALELYRNDNGQFPTPMSLSTCNSATGPQEWPASFRNALAPYISTLPKDPKHSSATCNAGQGFKYYYGYSGPITWSMGTNCSQANNSFVLYGNGGAGTKIFVNECGVPTGNSVNSFYLNKP